MLIVDFSGFRSVVVCVCLLSYWWFAVVFSVSGGFGWI